MKVCLDKLPTGELCTLEHGHAKDHAQWNGPTMIKSWKNDRPESFEAFVNKWGPVIVHRSVEFGKDMVQVVEKETGVPITEHVKTTQEEVKRVGTKVVKTVLEHGMDQER